MEVDSDLPIEIKPKPIRRKTMAPPIRYDIVSDVMNQKADISVADLMVAAPTLRRKLASACKPKRIPITETSKETMAVIEEDDINTTAVYSKINIGDKTVKVLVDCGAAKTCMSKSLADALGLEIDAASESVFTLGNGSKQPALGVIYDVPIEVQEDLIIPCTVEVLPSCPTHLIIGNNWLNRAKAKIDFNSSTLKVSYKNKKAEIEIFFLRKNTPLPKMSSYIQSYQHPISSTNSKETKKVHFEDDKTDSEEDEVDEESEESTDEESTEEEEAEDEEHSLLLLENNYNEDIQIKNLNDQCILEASSDGLIIPANSSKTITIKKPKDDLTELLYNFEITSTKILQKSGVLDPCHNFIINRKSLEIRIYNRSNDSVILDPGEEIGTLEKLNLKEDTIIQAYHVEKNLHLCTMKMTDEMDKETLDEDKETLETEKYNKLEVGEMDREIARKLKRLLKKYEEIFDWNNDSIGHTRLLQHKITIQEGTLPISHRPYRISPLEAEHLQKELEKYTKLGVISPSNSPWAAPVILVKKKKLQCNAAIFGSI